MPLIFVIFFSDIGQRFNPCNKTTDDLRRQIKDRIPELPTDRYFLDLSEKCLYTVNFGLGPFLWKSQKDCLHRFTLKLNANEQGRLSSFSFVSYNFFGSRIK